MGHRGSDNMWACLHVDTSKYPTKSHLLLWKDFLGFCLKIEMVSLVFLSHIIDTFSNLPASKLLCITHLILFRMHAVPLFAVIYLVTRTVENTPSVHPNLDVRCR
jgi:hypothetical protein